MEDHFDGVQPENDLPEDAETDQHALRYKAVLLLLVLSLPVILLLVEILTGRISGWWIETVQPHLPQLNRIIHF